LQRGWRHSTAAIVTGSTKGIGRAIAEALARAGASVVISSRKQEKCEEVAQALRAEGLDAAAIACHIGKKEELQALVEEARKQYGRIDVVVCNAADCLTSPAGSLTLLGLDIWRPCHGNDNCGVVRKQASRPAWRSCRVGGESP